MATPHCTPARSRAHPQGSEGPPPRPTSHTAQNPTRGTQEDNLLLTTPAPKGVSPTNTAQRDAEPLPLGITNHQQTQDECPGRPTGPQGRPTCHCRTHPTPPAQGGEAAADAASTPVRARPPSAQVCTEHHWLLLPIFPALKHQPWACGGQSGSVLGFLRPRH